MSKHDRRPGGQIQEPPMYDKQLDVSDKIDHDRLAAIDDARRAVRQVREKATWGVMQGTIPQKEAMFGLREALESYLLEIKQYRTIDETAQTYWTGIDDAVLGVVEISPPDEDGFEDAEPKTITLEALNDILHAPPLYTAEFETMVNHRHMAPRTKTETVEEPIPRHVLDRGVEWANAYVHHIGLDLQLQEVVDQQSQPF